jgi:hypothetical protein
MIKHRFIDMWDMVSREHCSTSSIIVGAEVQYDTVQRVVQSIRSLFSVFAHLVASQSN